LTVLIRRSCQHARQLDFDSNEPWPFSDAAEMNNAKSRRLDCGSRRVIAWRCAGRTERCRTLAQSQPAELPATNDGGARVRRRVNLCRRCVQECVRSASVKSEQPQCHLLLLRFLQPHVEGSHRRPARRLTRGVSHARASPYVRVKVRATVVDDGRKRQHLGTSRDLHPTPTLYESSSIAFFIYPLEWFVGVFVASADPFRLYP